MADKKMMYGHKQSSNAGYFFGLIGALVFYVNQAEGFGAVITAFLKALVWPAFVVYDLLTFIS